MVSESSNNSKETFLLLRPCPLWSVLHSEPRRILFSLQLDSVLRLLKPSVARDSLKGKAKVFAGTHKAPRDPPPSPTCPLSCSHVGHQTPFSKYTQETPAVALAVPTAWMLFPR